ncbi:hypothetical protein DIPPA_34829 [Diplonema papillatum]|nr:hypothetical protein DIPPA_34829 [Diplonema papillatum]
MADRFAPYSSRAKRRRGGGMKRSGHKRTEERRAERGGVVDRKSTCPLMARVFVRCCKQYRKPSLNVELDGKANAITQLFTADDFLQPNISSKLLPEEEVQMHTWADATLAELLSVVFKAKSEYKVSPDIAGYHFGCVAPVNHGSGADIRYLGQAWPKGEQTPEMKAADKSMSTLASLRHRPGEYLLVAVEQWHSEADEAQKQLEFSENEEGKGKAAAPEDPTAADVEKVTSTSEHGDEKDKESHTSALRSSSRSSSSSSSSSSSKSA